jgi:hypothetical protein
MQRTINGWVWLSDVAVLLVFAAIGRQNHGESNPIKCDCRYRITIYHCLVTGRLGNSSNSSRTPAGSGSGKVRSQTSWLVHLD